MSLPQPLWQPRKLPIHQMVKQFDAQKVPNAQHSISPSREHKAEPTDRDKETKLAA